MATALVFFLFYMGACLVVFRNSDFIEGMKGKSVSNSFAKQKLKASTSHSGTFYSEVAERLQFYTHDPQVITALYKMALRKAPADYKIPSSYAYYLVSRNCCDETLIELLQETLKRNPLSWKLQRFTGAYLLSKGHLKEALPHFRRASELQPHSTQEFYKLLKQKGATLQTLSEITPNRGDTRLQFAYYLLANGNVNQELKNVLYQLSEMQLQPEERLATAEIALKAGLTSLAEKQALQVLQSNERKGDAFQLLINIAWYQQNWKELEKRSSQLEKFYVDAGADEKAGECALQTVIRLAPAKNKAETKKRLLKVLNDYPNYAPAYEHMAKFSKDESEEITLYYWKKAVQLAPDHSEYKDQLAQTYLGHSRIRDAETIYNEIIGSEKDTQIGYLGLSRCSLRRNNPIMAIAILEQGLQKSGKFPELFLELGQISDSIHDYKRAAEAYREFTKLSPENIEGYILAAEAFLKQGDYSSARELYQEALKRDPGNQRASELLLQLNSM
jgi:cytochrome c-type biogenesis protein CcmH/NrfG